MQTQPLPVFGARGGGLPAAPPAKPAEQMEAQALVAQLKERIARLEESHHRLEPRHNGLDRSTKPSTPWRFGVAAMDAHLPAQGLSRHALHDLAPHAYGDTPATIGFAAALAMNRFRIDRKQRPILWCRSAIECREHGALYGHGLERLGLSRNKLFVLSLKKQVSLFWTMEEALKSGCFSSVISDAASQHVDLTITRRLSLSAAEGRTSGLLVLNRNYEGATASFSRWHVAATQSLPFALEAGAPGTPAWSVTLSRIRGGRPGQWTLTWQPLSRPSTVPHHASHHFSLVSGISGGTLSQGTAKARPAHGTPASALRAG